MPACRKRSCPISGSEPISNTISESQRGKEYHLTLLDTTESIDESMIEHREQHHLDRNAKLGHSITDYSEEASGSSRRQETEVDDIYADLPVLLEHRYKEAIGSRQVVGYDTDCQK